MINEDLDPQKQPNFYDGQQLNVNDLEQLQIFLNKKIETGIHDIGFDGLVEATGLQVNPDSIMVEPFVFPIVPQSDANPNLQNFRDFPEDVLDIQDVKMYQVFKAETNNIQRFDLKLQLIQGAGNSQLLVELVELTVPSNPLSTLSLNTLFTKQFEPEDIPTTSSDGRLIVDVSSQNEGQGISLVVGSYYAILIRFLRETGSQDKLRVFHSNVTETAAIDSNLYAHFFVNGNFQQGLFNENAELVGLVLYHQVYTSAVRIEVGSAYFKGEHILVEEPQRFLSVVDRRNITDAAGEHFNFVAIKFVLDPTDPELHPRTGNSVDSRFEDTFATQVFNKAGWDVELAKGEDREWLLLAIVVDRNIIPFRERFVFTLSQRTNLAYNDWLNSCITTPSLPALQLKAARPDDFVFFVDNVPAEVPLIDDNGNQVFDELGRAIVDNVAHVFLTLYLDGGVNTRKFEMALNSSTSTTPPFNSYFVTITDPDSELIPSLANFAFDVNELTPNTFYNFVAITERGRSIFLQDFNVQIRTPDPNTGILSLTRSRIFNTRLNAGSLTAIINEDLKLGTPIVAFGNVGQRVTGFDSILHVDEDPIRNGVTASQTINPVTDTLLEASVFKFEPLPMCLELGTLIGGNNTDVQTAVAADDIVIKVNTVPVTYSGTEGPERGGTGAPHTVSGRVLFSDNAAERQAQINALGTSVDATPTGSGGNHRINDLVGLRVTVRDINGRDNSQQNIIAVTQMDGFPQAVTSIARAGSTATVTTSSPHGFSSGDEVLIGGANEVQYNGFFTITVTGATTFTYTVTGSPSTPATGTITATRDQFLVYRVIAMGRGTGNPAGFSTGEEGFLHIQNRPARDIVGVPLRFIYTPFGASILDVRQVDSQELWFGERNIIYATSAAALANDEVGIDPIGGQVYWNDHDLDLIFHQLDLTATIEYFQLDQRFAVVNFYQTHCVPWGCTDDCAIDNEDVAVQNAVAAGEIIIKVNGQTTYTIGFTTIDLTNSSNFVAMHPGQPSMDQSLLPPDKISLDPHLGKIVFGADIRPDPGAEVTITYYCLRPITTCVANAMGAVYDVRFDFNLDGRVDETDLNQFLAAFNSHTGDPNYSAMFDFNNDGDVDADDFQDFLDHFGTVSSGLPTFEDATDARLKAILVFQKDNPLRRFHVVRAVSMPPSVEFPLGRSVFFFAADTPILTTGDYSILFGFAAALLTGVNNVTVTTNLQVTSQLNRDVVEVFNESDPTDVRDVIDVSSTSRILPGDVTVYDNVVTFTPSVTTSSNFIVRALWDGSGLAVINRSIYIKTVGYELQHRRRFGPFKMSFTSSDFAPDGSALTIRFDRSEATFADHSSDPSGLHLDGIPLHQMRFAVWLLVPVDNNLVNIWRWHHFVPQQSDQGIKLQFNEFLSLDSRFTGKNGVPVLQPFGTAKNQVDLRPKYASGDVENNLVNVIVVRDDYLPNYPVAHNHTSDAEGGILTSENITFADPQARFVAGDVTDIIYQLQDGLQAQINALTARLADLQLDASQVIVTDARGCFGAPSGQLTLADAINKILDFIAWDNLSDCP